MHRICLQTCFCVHNLLLCTTSLIRRRERDPCCRLFISHLLSQWETLFCFSTLIAITLPTLVTPLSRYPLSPSLSLFECAQKILCRFLCRYFPSSKGEMCVYRPCHSLWHCCTYGSFDLRTLSHCSSMWDNGQRREWFLHSSHLFLCSLTTIDYFSWVTNSLYTFSLSPPCRYLYRRKGRGWEGGEMIPSFSFTPRSISCSLSEVRLTSPPHLGETMGSC